MFPTVGKDEHFQLTTFLWWVINTGFNFAVHVRVTRALWQLILEKLPRSNYTFLNSLNALFHL